jgi:hypothetical protein
MIWLSQIKIDYNSSPYYEGFFRNQIKNTEELLEE